MNKAYILLCFFIFYSCSWGTHDTPASLRPYSNASLICNIAPASNSYGFLFYSPADWEVVITCQLGEVEILEGPSVYPQSGLGSSSLQSVNFTVPENNTDQTLVNRNYEQKNVNKNQDESAAYLPGWQYH